jgi:hypothetical protein
MKSQAQAELCGQGWSPPQEQVAVYGRQVCHVQVTDYDEKFRDTQRLHAV